MTSFLTVATILYFYGTCLNAATIRNKENEYAHNHLTWNFHVPGKKGLQLSAVLYNEDAINSEKISTGFQSHQQCQTHQEDHKDYTWNFVLSDIKEIELKTLLDNNTIAKIDVNNETDIENLVIKGSTVSGIELKTLPPYNEMSDEHDQQSQTLCPECKENKSVTVQGLHWKDWAGSIPPDAIVGDYNILNGSKIPVYLAQGLLQVKNAGLIPTSLTNGSKHVSLPFEGVTNVSQNIKVLCGNQEDVTWISWERASHLNKERDYVNAGFERTFPLYFGRCRHKGQYVFGKVVLRDLATYFAYEDTEYYIKSFDILCHRSSLAIDQFVKN